MKKLTKYFKEKICNYIDLAQSKTKTLDKKKD